MLDSPYISDATVFSSELVSSRTVTASVALLWFFLPPEAVLLNSPDVSLNGIQFTDTLQGLSADTGGGSYMHIVDFAVELEVFNTAVAHRLAAQT